MSTKGDIKATIPKGCDNAILLRDLANVVGVEARQVKRHIQDLRFEGEPIISKTDGGYYYPELGSAADMANARRFIAMMRDQADQRYVTARVVEGWLENAEKEEKEPKR